MRGCNLGQERQCVPHTGVYSPEFRPWKPGSYHRHGGFQNAWGSKFPARAQQAPDETAGNQSGPPFRDALGHKAQTSWRNAVSGAPMPTPSVSWADRRRKLITTFWKRSRTA